MKSLDSAKATAIGKEAFVLYFCASEHVDVIGGTSKAREDFKLANGGKNPPNTIWDNSAVLDVLKKEGITIYAKVPAIKENAEVFKKYGAVPGTLVVCGPNGEKLQIFTGERCKQGVITGDLKGFRERFDAWQKQQESKKSQEKPTVSPSSGSK